MQNNSHHDCYHCSSTHNVGEAALSGAKLNSFDVPGLGFSSGGLFSEFFFRVSPCRFWQVLLVAYHFVMDE